MKNILLILLPALLIVGCAAMGIPATDDPKKKIGYAYQLFDKQQRPLPAEKLIREAIDIFKSKNDQFGLAEAYRAYGFFFRSAAIKKWSKNYESSGFREKSATYENRYDKSIEYFKKAESIFLKLERGDRLTNIYFNMGHSYGLAGNNTKACEAYYKSITTHKKEMKLHPTNKLIVPDGVETFEDLVGVHLKRLSCK